MTAQAKTAIVTASYSGIGRELSRQLVEGGYRLGVVNRDPARAARMVKEITQAYPGAAIQSYTTDLSDHVDIRRVAGEIATDFPRVDVLFNNAGVLLPELRYSPQGNEMHFEINTVAPFLLLHLLKPQLANADGGVVVTSGSGARRMARSLSVDQLRSPTSFTKMSGPMHSRS